MEIVEKKLVNYYKKWLTNLEKCDNILVMKKQNDKMSGGDIHDKVGILI